MPSRVISNAKYNDCIVFSGASSAKRVFLMNITLFSLFFNLHIADDHCIKPGARDMHATESHHHQLQCSCIIVSNTIYGTLPDQLNKRSRMTETAGNQTLISCLGVKGRRAKTQVDKQGESVGRKTYSSHYAYSETLGPYGIHSTESGTPVVLLSTSNPLLYALMTGSWKLAWHDTLGYNATVNRPF